MKYLWGIIFTMLFFSGCNKPERIVKYTPDESGMNDFFYNKYGKDYVSLRYTITDTFYKRPFEELQAEQNLLKHIEDSLRAKKTYVLDKDFQDDYSKIIDPIKKRNNLSHRGDGVDYYFISHYYGLGSNPDQPQRHALIILYPKDSTFTVMDYDGVTTEVNKKAK